MNLENREGGFATNDFIQARHAHFALAESSIDQLVRQATGQEPVRRARIVRGRNNEVHVVATDQQEQFVVRILRHSEVSLQQEAWAIEQCRAQGVPVPEVLWVGSVVEGSRSVETMVQRRAAGQALSVLQPDLDRQQLESAYAQAGEALSRIHAVSAGGFYRLRANGCWDFPNWEQLMTSHLSNRTAEAPEWTRCGFTPQEIQVVIESIERYAAEFRCDDPVLCHGDFHPEHLIFTDDLQLSAVIDFGDFLGGPPVHDFAVMKMVAPEADPRWLLAGYGDAGESLDRFWVRLLLHQVGMQAGYLAYEFKEGDPKRAAQMADGLQTLLRDLRSHGE
jgi:aminoglycoside phosphotransferase (APT) family kinase protein